MTEMGGGSKKPKGSIKEAPLEILQSSNRSDGIVKIM